MDKLYSLPEYRHFRSNIPLKKICVGGTDGEESWTIFDAGPRTVTCPLILFPPASGQADVFYKQLLALSGTGYRVIAVQYPVYWSPMEFSNGFRRLIDHLRLDKASSQKVEDLLKSASLECNEYSDKLCTVHIFGASLGGFLAQKFAEHTRSCQRVQSLILCNSFVDTSAFHQSQSSSTYWMLPTVVLKTMVMGPFEKGSLDADIVASIDFMVHSLDGLSQQELASRLTLNCADDYIQPQKLRDIPVMIIDVNDPCSISQQVKEEVYKCYPYARRGHLKSGGNFPYLSRAAEVNIFLQVHLSQFVNTRYSAMDENAPTAKLYRSALSPPASSRPSPSSLAPTSLIPVEADTDCAAPSSSSSETTMSISKDVLCN